MAALLSAIPYGFAALGMVVRPVHQTLSCAWIWSACFG